nr:hypothetical protein [Methanobrevibacter arboriphilus]
MELNKVVEPIYTNIVILLIVSVITAIIINIINTHEKNSIDNNKN